METADGQASQELQVDKEQEPYRVSVTETVLNCLLRDQEVLVRWWEYEQGRSFPINVDLLARQDLPVAPGTSQLAEHSLIAYYQGRVSWEELFPPPVLPPTPTPTPPSDDGGSEVDTSKIQSYQIREFVEALAGIRQELREASESSRPRMRLALLGSVSPVALATRIAEAAGNGRTPTAAGFQLVELLACLQSSRSFPKDRGHYKDWASLVDEAESHIRKRLDEMRQQHRDALSSPMFARYEATVLKHPMPKAARP